MLAGVPVPGERAAPVSDRLSRWFDVLLGGCVPFFFSWVAGEKGRRIRELTRIVQNRFKFEEGQVELYAERIDVRGLCAQTQAESEAKCFC